MRILRTLALSLLLVLIPLPEAASAAPGPTPYMGWNTYFGLGGDPTETEVKSIADFMAANGLREAGYKIIWIDGNWAAPTPRNARGDLVADPARFPSGMPALTKYLHDRGFQAGIYTDAGPYLEGQCGLGSYGHYRNDVRLFARWGFDALKADWLCGRASGMDPETTFRALAAEVTRSPRPMIFNICNPVSSDWGGGPYTPQQLSTWSYTYAPEIADSWRTYTDVGLVTSEPRWQWDWVLRNMDVNAYHPAATSPGHFNDPDYLLPMRPGELTFEESRTQLGMWAIMASPLIIGSDPRGLPAPMLEALRNPEIIAVDQDPLVRQGVKVAGDVWSKTLSGTGRRAVALLNRGDTARRITVTFADVALTGPVQVRDLWSRSSLGEFTGSYTIEVPAHGTAMLKLTGTDQVRGDDLGAAGTDSPSVAGGHVFTRGADGVLQEYVDGAWRGLGRKIQGRPAAYASAGGRIDVFVRGRDNRAWQLTLVNGRRRTWADLGGALTSSPSVAFASPTSWTLFARSADGQVKSRGTRPGWTSLGAPYDGPIQDSPTASIDGAGAIHVSVRSPTDEIWDRVLTGGTWSSWQNLGGTLNTSPTAVTTEGRIYLFAVAADRRLWQNNHVGGAWGGWFPRSEFATDEIQGPVGAEPGVSGSATLVLRGIDNHIHRTTL
ncbi:glycoside hydrolase family 27 protein [Actinoplanes sp. NBRC 103695]|uniref:glycoside hydrolase family 27 protein n=1 Tax=Actinoplanes sp. NBRC 103695 TaxID=3032202 RepID=UPI0024A5340C|nr:glycoside hydrolase family 27 protein [Actinoplanes sp. NBRC 103695]GLY98858.1 hypothetical protein Acsp02_61120 [Actinoplanes sp. NBRC 103695]